MLNKEKGITLIKLLIILIVIVMLATIVIIVIYNKINKGNKNTAENFEKYILGQDKNGRVLIGENGIINKKISLFRDDPLTKGIDEKTVFDVTVLYSYVNEKDIKRFIYAKYDNKVYKITCDIETNMSEKLEIIYTPSGREGEKLENGWTILYDNGDTFEAISPKAMGKLRLGYSEDTKKEKEKLKETIESYNTAIKEINEYCKELKGLPKNIGVRSVGTAIETTEEKYSSASLKRWNAKYDGVMLEEDINFEQDLIRMRYWKVIDVEESYWIASRCVDEKVNGLDSGDIHFGVRKFSDEEDAGFLNLIDINSTGWVGGNYSESAVRPIITIKK